MIAPDSIAGQAYGARRSREEFFCSYGLAPGADADLAEAGLIVSGRSDDGQARIMELAAHPFFVLTLFLPQARPAAGGAHPLLVAFAAACASVA